LTALAVLGSSAAHAAMIYHYVGNPMPHSVQYNPTLGVRSPPVPVAATLKQRLHLIAWHHARKAITSLVLG
jgi:hypothetical protein